MNTTFIIDGGAGRVISAIPALETYHKNNPNDDFKILIHGWRSLFWYHPTLGSRAHRFEEQGSFEKHVLNNRCVTLEPYRLYEYYHDHVSIAQAFDIIVNGKQTHKTYKPSLFISPAEQKYADEIINEIKMTACVDKVVVFQPFGSSSLIPPPDAGIEGAFDPTGRSLSTPVFDSIVDNIGQDVAIIYFGPKELWVTTNKKTFTLFQDDDHADIRQYLAVVANCDLFVGCDSIGQHMARSFDIPGIILMGNTLETNVSYPDYSKFKFVRRKGFNPVYCPLRFNHEDQMVIQQACEGILDFNASEIDSIATDILDLLDV